MSYLLAQIGLCLLLAAIAGWYIGWSWRGFRDRDTVDDAKRTLRATEEVKDRELSEAYRRADALQSQLERQQRRSRNIERELEQGKAPKESRATTSSAPLSSSATPGGETFGSALTVRHLVPVATPQAPPNDADQTRVLRAKIEAERKQREESESQLARKAATVLQLQAQVNALGKSMDAKAEEIAHLKARLIEAEPLAERLRLADKRIAGLQQAHQVDADERAAVLQRARKAEEVVEQLRADVAERDRAVNDLRSRHNDAVAALQRAEAAAQQQMIAPDPAHLARLEGELEESRQRLQRQIERNRKQDAVHRSVVDDLQERLQASDPGRAELEQLRKQVAALENELEGLEDRDRRIDVLQEQLRAVEQSHDEEIERYRGRLDRLQRPVHPTRQDDLQVIRGIGPKLSERLHEIGISRYEQIAAWNDEEIERVSRQIGAWPGRIRGDRWVESARELLGRSQPS